jgi:hypothetical protein
MIEAEPLPEFTLKGVAKPVVAHNVVRLNTDHDS